MTTIGGTLIIRNAVAYDYCIEAALYSLLGVCDEVVVVDGESDDGTWEWLQAYPHWLKNQRGYDLILCQRPWKPSPLGTWLADLTNEARKQLTTNMHLNLQADEVLHEADYPVIRACAEARRSWRLNRLNFWLDPQHMLRPEVKVGSRIVRLAPTSVPCIGDAQGLQPSGATDCDARIYHYGFLRNPQKLAAKARPMLKAFFNLADPIFDAVEQRGLEALGDATFATAVPREQLLPYTGTHPKVAHGWLREHGFTV